MLHDLFILAYCGAVGFASAGAVSSLFGMVTATEPRFVLLGRSWLGALSSFLFFAFTGPAILAALVLRRRVDGGESLGVAIGGIAVAALWSVCSGLVVVQFALAITRDVF